MRTEHPEKFAASLHASRLSQSSMRIVGCCAVALTSSRRCYHIEPNLSCVCARARSRAADAPVALECQDGGRALAPRRRPGAHPASAFRRPLRSLTFCPRGVRRPCCFGACRTATPRAPRTQPQLPHTPQRVDGRVRGLDRQGLPLGGRGHIFQTHLRRDPRGPDEPNFREQHEPRGHRGRPLRRWKQPVRRVLAGAAAQRLNHGASPQNCPGPPLPTSLPARSRASRRLRVPGSSF